MSIRIRVYPQAGSIGARRTKAIKQQQLRMHQQQLAQIRFQQEQVQRMYGSASGWGSPLGASSSYGSYGQSWSPPFAGSYGAPYGAYAPPVPPAIAPIGSAMGGSVYLGPGVLQVGSIGMASGSPYLDAAYAGRGLGWGRGW